MDTNISTGGATATSYYAEGVTAISRRSSEANTAGYVEATSIRTPQGVPAFEQPPCCDPFRVNVVIRDSVPVVFAALKPPANGCDPSRIKGSPQG